jgi:uridylate kinase
MLGVNRFLLKLSGKIVDPENAELVKKYAVVINRLVDEGYRVAIIVGGGTYARNYISCARVLGLSNAQADMVGIEVARVNALLFAYAIGERAYVPIPRSIEEVERAWSTGKVVVAGGLQPGQSTAAVAAIVAETLGIRRILYATDVDGVYDKDPKMFSNAKKFERISVDELARVLSQRFEAGGYQLLDPIAMQVVKRSCIDVVIFNGFHVENVEKAAKGEAIGTLVIPCS